MVPMVPGIVGFVTGWFVVSLISYSFVPYPWRVVVSLAGGVFVGWFLYRQALRRRLKGIENASVTPNKEA